MSNKVSDKILKRVYLLFGAVSLFSLVILFRVVQIQFFQAEKWTAMVEKERVYEKRVPAARGNILADNGEVLATSQPFYRLPIDPTRIDTESEAFPAELDSLTTLLAERFGTVDRGKDWFHDRIMRKIEENDRHLYLVHSKVDYEDYREIRSWPILRESKYQGGLIEDKLNNTRFYPNGRLARITLGVMMQDTIPIKGLEFAFHKYLRGTEGVALVQKIAGGDAMPLEVFRPDEDGADIETTISVEMQDIVSSELQAAVEYHKAKYGVAILMETETGEVKAIANYPEVQNHAVATRIEPGSTFKLATFMAALEDRAVNLDDSIDTGNGNFKFYDKWMKDHLALGKITYRHGFEESSNIVASRLLHDTYKDRVERWFTHLDKFGLTDIVMPQEHIVGEPTPIIVGPDHPDWVGTTLPWMSIGYNLQITPMQILAFYNAVANDGKMIEPILVKRVRKGARTMHEFEPTVLNSKIASDRTLKKTRELLEGVVENGTAKRLKISECKLAGKTGTAKKFIDSLNAYANIYQASFCGYFPADDPRYTCYVMIDEPSAGQIYGATVAGPVFRNIAKQVHTADLGLVPDFQPEPGQTAKKPITRIVHQTNAETVYKELDIKAPKEAEGTWVRASDDEGKIKFDKVELAPGKVPNVRGMSAKDAVALIEGLGMKVSLKGHGKVKKQSLAAGAQIEPMQTMELELK